MCIICNREFYNQLKSLNVVVPATKTNALHFSSSLIIIIIIIVYVSMYSPHVAVQTNKSASSWFISAPPYNFLSEFSLDGKSVSWVG